jgi:hypothetical protein
VTETNGLAQALATLMTKLPEIKKVSEAKVETKGGGSYKYTYADLAQISRVLLPILGECGLSFITKPTMTDDGRMVLAYKLLHVTGQSEDGQYPLPTGGTPQSMGSAITYARRYCLCAVTGVAPDEDDDGAAAQANYHHQAARPAPQPEPQWERPAPEPVTDQAWATKFETRVAAADSEGKLKGLYEELCVKFDIGQLTPTDREVLGKLVALRKTELEESPA